MTDVLHGALVPGAASGIHVVQAWEVANAAARTALTVASTDIGRVCRQIDTGVFYLLTSVSPAVWTGVADATVVAANTAAILTKADRVQTSLTTALTAITLDSSHVEQNIRTTAATAVGITVPLNFSAMSIGQFVSGMQIGAGRVQFIKGDPTIIFNTTGQYYTRVAGSPWSLYKAGTNEYDLSGDLLV